MSGLTITGEGISALVSIPIKFKAGFAGVKKTFLYANDSTGLNTAWVLVGGWTVSPPTAPSPLGVAPSAGSGLNGTFRFQIRDGSKPGGIELALFLINNGISGAASCYFFYSPSSGTIALAANDGNTWRSANPGSPTSLSNSQCTLGAQETSVTYSGGTLTLNIGVSFRATWAGAKNIYALGIDRDGLVSHWKHVGSWTVP